MHIKREATDLLILKITLLFLFATVFSCKTSNQVIVDKKKQSTLSILEIRIDSLENEIHLLRNQQSNPIFEPGKIYLQCVNGAQFERIDILEYIIYTGDNIHIAGIEKIYIEKKPSYNRWVKRNYQDICPVNLRDDNTDETCNIWSFEIVSAEIDTVYIVNDTISIKDFEIIRYEKIKVIKQSEFIGWSNVVCPNIHGPNIITKVQTALRSKGYNLEINNKMNKRTKQALLDYQRKNNLPMGNIDFETLKSLGVED